MEAWMNGQHIGKLLRGIGSLLLLAAGTSFMLEGWHAFGSQSRFFVFLCYILVISGLGIFTGWYAREEKGARTLLGLGVACTAMQFSQLGAMIFSFTDPTITGLPKVMIYNGVGIRQVLLDGFLIFLLLTPVVFLGLSALIRAKARVGTVVYLVSCSALLLPVREGGGIAVVLVALVAFLLWIDSRHLGTATVAPTQEGMISRLMIIIPVVILIGRSFFYPADSLFLGTVLIVLGIATFQTLPRVLEKTEWISLIQGWSTVSIIGGWLFIVHDVFPTTPYRVAIVLLPISGILTILSFHAFEGGCRYRKIAAGIALAAVTGNLATHPGIGTSVFCIASSLCMVLLGHHLQEKTAFAAGGMGLGIGLCYHLRFAVELYQSSPWIFLALLGLLTLAGSTYFEKHSRQLFGRMIQFRQELKSWS